MCACVCVCVRACACVCVYVCVCMCLLEVDGKFQALRSDFLEILGGILCPDRQECIRGVLTVCNVNAVSPGCVFSFTTQSGSCLLFKTSL